MPVVDQLSPEVAKKIVESLLPDKQARGICLRILAASIEQAHSISPGSWSLTLADNKVRLNVGRIEVLAIFHDVFHVVLHNERGPTRYRWVSGSYTEDLPAAEVGEKFPGIAGSHRRLVSLATKTGRHSPWAFAHSLGALRYLEGVVGRSIAEPRKLHVHRFVLRRQFERFVSEVEKREKMRNGALSGPALSINGRAIRSGCETRRAAGSASLNGRNGPLAVDTFLIAQSGPSRSRRAPSCAITWWPGRIVTVPQSRRMELSYGLVLNRPRER